jgi:hypothetical protein
MNTSPADAQPSNIHSPEPLITITAPTPVDDLERRLQLLRDCGVRAYKDGPLEIVFSAPPKRENPEERAFRMIAEADAASRGA